MDGSGLHFTKAQLEAAAVGFLAASKDARKRAQAMAEALRPYAMNPERFQGPVADGFRKLYAEINDDLLVVKEHTEKLSALVEGAKTQFLKETDNAAGALPKGGGGSDNWTGGDVFNALK